MLHVLWRRAHQVCIGRGPPSGPGRGNKEPCKEELGEFSVFCEVRSELLRPILDHLDPVKQFRMCS